MFGGEDEAAFSDDDTQLLLAAANGDERAFRHLMERHMSGLQRFVQGLLGRTGADTADDIAQEAFLRVWLNAARYDPARARFGTWLRRIALNLVRDRMRAFRPHEDDSVLAELPSAEPGMLEELEAQQRRDAADAAMQALPARQREAVVLFHFEHLSLRQCAEVMGVGEKAFESLLIRARAALRTRLMTVEAR